MKAQNFEITSSVMDEYDVLVIGGGTAGSIAAIQAGRLGAKTGLIEKTGILGGTMTMAAVNFPGLFHAWGRQIIAGIAWEVIETVNRWGGAKMPDISDIIPSQHWRQQIPVNRFILAAVLDTFCLQAGVVIHLHEMVSTVKEENDSLVVLVTSKTGLRCLRTKILIDATGDADVAGMMGYQRQQSKSLQPGTLIYHLSGYKPENVDFDCLDRLYKKALSEGKILPTDHAFSPIANPYHHEIYNFGGNCMHIDCKDADSSQGKTCGEIKARESLVRTYLFLKQVPGLEHLNIDFAADECGIRETWRIVGLADVTYETYTNGFVWPDAICYSFFPIDVHQNDSNRIDTRALKEGVVATIPLRALIPKESKRLLAAGRCISGDSEASSAYRVQATCMATGQAAGVAAVIAARQNIKVSEVNAEEIRSILRNSGAIIP